MAVKPTYLCAPSMNIKHVMAYVSSAGYNLIGHVENWTDNQREHALEARVKALEQRRLQMIKYIDIQLQ